MADEAPSVFRVTASDVTGFEGWTLYVVALDEISALMAATKSRSYSVWATLSVTRLETLTA